MKMIKMISLEPELMDKLKREDNASELICNLLFKHYSSETKEERELSLKQELAKLQSVKEEYDKLQKEKQDLEGNKIAEKELREQMQKDNEEYRRIMREGVLGK